METTIVCCGFILMLILFDPAPLYPLHRNHLKYGLGLTGSSTKNLYFLFGASIKNADTVSGLLDLVLCFSDCDRLHSAGIHWLMAQP